MSQPNNLSVGIDIGTSKIAICAGVLQEGHPVVLGLTKSPSSGVTRGSIVNIEETVSALSTAIVDAEQLTGSTIRSAVIGVSDPRIIATTSKGVVAVNQANSVVTEADMQRAVEAAQAVALPPNQEVIHILPRAFSVDGQEPIKDPSNMTGVRLEVDTFVIGAPTATMRNLNQAVRQAGLEIQDIIYAPLAASNTLLDNAQRESGVILIDIGASTTSIIVFEEGEIIHTAILPLGSSHITNDIAIGLRTNLHNAERIKQELAYALSSSVGADEIIDLSEFDPNEDGTTNRKYVSEIVEARLNELFSMIQEELRQIGRDGKLPAGAVFTGGGARLAGLVEAAKELLRLPASIGMPQGTISGMIDRLDDPIYSTSVGLMLNGLTGPSLRNSQIPLGSIDKYFDGFTNKAKNIFKHLLP